MEPPIIWTFGLEREYYVGDAPVRALRSVSLSVTRGEFVAVIGPSGSGKSTLMNILGLLDQPSGGAYQLEGLDAGSLNPDERAKLRSQKIGFVFQNYNLLRRSTALQNVELPLVYARRGRRERRHRAEEALAFVGLTDRRNHVPSQLSGGEQQRVAVARALVNDPTLILADEPTGALDSETGGEVIKLLRALNAAGRTIILVTHNATIAQSVDRVVRMRDGQIESEPPLALVYQQARSGPLSEQVRGRSN